jgi:hypothetical protein
MLHHRPFAVLLSCLLTLALSGCVHTLGGAVLDEDTHAGIAGVALTLTDNSSASTKHTTTKRTTTDASGNFKFTELGSGKYELAEAQPAGYVSTTTKIGSLYRGTSRGDKIVDIEIPQSSTPLEDLGYIFGERKSQTAHPPLHVSVENIGSGPAVLTEGAVRLKLDTTGQVDNFELSPPTGWQVNPVDPWTRELKGAGAVGSSKEGLTVHVKAQATESDGAIRSIDADVNIPIKVYNAEKTFTTFPKYNGRPPYDITGLCPKPPTGADDPANATMLVVIEGGYNYSVGPNLTVEWSGGTYSTAISSPNPTLHVEYFKGIMPHLNNFKILLPTINTNFPVGLVRVQLQIK